MAQQAVRDLAYYKRLPYRVEVERVSEEDGVYYVASFPELGGVLSHGDTRLDALYYVRDAFDETILALLELEADIPLPERAVPPANVDRLIDGDETNGGLIRIEDWFASSDRSAPDVDGPESDGDGADAIRYRALA